MSSVFNEFGMGSGGLCLGLPALPLAPVGAGSPPVEGSRRKVLRSVVLLELKRAEKWVPVVLVPDPVPGDARMVLPPALARSVERLTRAPSAGSPPSR